MSTTFIQPLSLTQHLLPIHQVSFGSKYGVRELWMKGKLPQVKTDIYGLPLSKKTCSREHVIPKSLGGSSRNSNIALADKNANNARGTKPLNQFTTLENVVKYLFQFVGIKIKDKANHVCFDGTKYAEKLIPSLEHEGFKLDIKG